MVTFDRQSFTMLPVVQPNPFIVGLPPTVSAAQTPTTNATASVCPETSTMKPRLAFSIDSIVGDDRKVEEQRKQKHSAISSLTPQLSSSTIYGNYKEREQLTTILRKSSNHFGFKEVISQVSQPLELRSTLSVPAEISPVGIYECSPMYRQHDSALNRSPSRDCSISSCDRSRSPIYAEFHNQRSRSTTPTHLPNEPPSPDDPQIVNGPIPVSCLPTRLIRPHPLQASPNFTLVQPTASPREPTSSHPHHGSISPQAQAPPIHPHATSILQAVPPTQQTPCEMRSHLPPNPHFLAAQFQMAAVLAHHHHQQQQQQQHQQQTGHHLQPDHPLTVLPPGLHRQHQHFGPPPHLIRDSYPLYPWLISRHGRIFSHRFPGNFLLQPFRKPKRVRTAFSPTQLLKLEHAFEGNHYVVGAERKQLAQGLSLTETQVKVWFQNRRTKHKRMQQENDSDSKGQTEHSTAGNNDGGDDGSQTSLADQDNEDDEVDPEDEEAVIDMGDCDNESDADKHGHTHHHSQDQLVRPEQLQHRQQHFLHQHLYSHHHQLQPHPLQQKQQ